MDTFVAVWGNRARDQFQEPSKHRRATSRTLHGINQGQFLYSIYSATNMRKPIFVATMRNLVICLLEYDNPQASKDIAPLFLYIWSGRESISLGCSK